MRPILVALGATALAATAATALPAQQPGARRDSTRDTLDTRPDARRPRAQRPDAARRAESLLRVFGGGGLAPDRAVIGITLGEADTRGIRVADVAADGPAARAGIKAGDYLTAVGDASLRVSAADLEDPVLRTTAERRLRRALERANAGDELTLRVASGDAERAVRLRTVRADQLEPARAATAEPGDRPDARTRDGDRATIGISVGGTGTARDTLGAFVMSVVPGSPAERAGIYEGARIASVNGVDLRVDRADVEDEAIASARAARLEEQLRRATAGDEVTLRVYADGRWRDVRVRTAKASEVYPEGMMRTLPGGMMPGRMLWRGPGGATTLRVMPGGGARTFVVPRGGEGRFEVVTPEGRWEGEVPRVRLERAPRVRPFRDGDRERRLERDELESLSPEVRTRVERRLEEARRRLRVVTAPSVERLNFMTD